MNKYDDPELNKAIAQFKRALTELRLLKAIELVLLWVLKRLESTNGSGKSGVVR